MEEVQSRPTRDRDNAVKLGSTSSWAMPSSTGAKEAGTKVESISINSWVLQGVMVTMLRASISMGTTAVTMKKEALAA